MENHWLQQIFNVPDLHRMGHGQTVPDLNLGLGWLYYAQVRASRPLQAVCIGSWRGFVPLVLAKGLQDNGDGGRLAFIDPSLVDDFWADPARVSDWWQRFGIDNIDHHRLTTQAFARTPAMATLGPIGLLFVDGLHTAEQARFDHETFAPLLTPDAVVCFHDSVRHKQSRMYGEDKTYQHSVVDYIDELKRRPDLQVMDFPLSSGVTLVRHTTSPHVVGS
jgi:predicted O-methyltransferase YrrM